MGCPSFLSLWSTQVYIYGTMHLPGHWVAHCTSSVATWMPTCPYCMSNRTAYLCVSAKNTTCTAAKLPFYTPSLSSFSGSFCHIGSQIRYCNGSSGLNLYLWIQFAFHELCFHRCWSKFLFLGQTTLVPNFYLWSWIIMMNSTEETKIYNNVTYHFSLMKN